MSRRVHIAMLAAALATPGCGRTGLGPLPKLIAQVVDEADEPVSSADVDLIVGPTDDDLAIEHARTDREGVAIFEHPGPGRVHLSAHTDLTCCLREGTADATLGGSTEIVLVHAHTGPCPTAVPVSCGN